MPTLADLLNHGLKAVAVSLLIAIGLSVGNIESFGINLLYSMCIGMLIWLLIESGQRALVRDWNRHWRRVWIIVPLAVVLGYVGGTLLADQLLGTPSQAYWLLYPGKFFGLLLMSLGVGAAMSYYFMSREQLASERQRAEEALRQAAESRLRLLQSQLEPHMLFNTLANLRALIAVDAARALAMLDHLNAYLRATLSASRQQQHTLREEFARLHDYLELMAVRMGLRLRFHLDLPQELENATVPPLLLQPLVENAIRHGLEPKPEGGRLDVLAALQDGALCLEVRDNGVGMAPGTADGFGLAQVRERLDTVYGARSAIEMLAPAAGGVCVRLHISQQP
jgi:signal transduction histidine kinase